VYGKSSKHRHYNILQICFFATGAHLQERVGPREAIVVEPAHEPLPGMFRHLARERDLCHERIRTLVKVKGTLVAQLVRDLGLTIVERTRGVDDRERHRVFQSRDSGVVMLEDRVAGQALVDGFVGVALLTA
jgi:hypothetical protein